MGEEKQIIMYANFSDDPQKLEPMQATSTYHLVAHSEGLVSMTVNLPTNVNSDVDFYFNRYTHKVVTAVNGVATLIVKAETEEDKDREFPSEVLREPGFTVSIIYENNNNQITTNYVFFPVYTNGIGEEPLEYDDDSYIDAKIAREAAEYALDEIDDLTDRVTTLESGLTTLSSVVETTISSLEEFEETTTSSFDDLKEWVDYNSYDDGNGIFYPLPSNASDFITIASSTPSKSEHIHCSGSITHNQTWLEFSIPLPKSLRKLPDSKQYKIKDLALIARGMSGIYGDYYAHGLQRYTFKVLSDAITTNTSWTNLQLHNETIDEDRGAYLFATIADVENSAYDNFKHNYHNGVRTAASKITTTAEQTTTSWGPIQRSLDLNTDGLLFCKDGSPIPIICWDNNAGRNVSTEGSTFKIETYVTESKLLHVTISMPFNNSQYPFIFKNDGYTAGMNDAYVTTTTGTENYKKWLPLHGGSFSSEGPYVTTGTTEEQLDARFRIKIPKNGPINNTPVDVIVSVLTLYVVDV